MVVDLGSFERLNDDQKENFDAAKERKSGYAGETKTTWIRCDGNSTSRSEFCEALQPVVELLQNAGRRLATGDYGAWMAEKSQIAHE